MGLGTRGQGRGTSARRPGGCPRRGRSGFTLLEVVIAGGALMLGLVGLASTLGSGLALNDAARHLTLATAAAHQELEAIKALSFATAVQRDGAFEVPGLLPSAVSTFVEVVQDPTDPRDVAQVTSANLAQVTVTVCWRQGLGRVLGEDQNLDGVFTVDTEDANGNGVLDSPAQLTTLIARR